MKAAAPSSAPLFIVLEGLDGAGTTTQSERIAAALRALGHRVLITREPSEGPIGTLIRQALTHRLQLPDGKPLSASTLALLFAADRVDHLDSVIAPALRRGEIVVSDRYVLSSLAYQGTSLPPSWVDDINRQATPADLTLFIDVDAPTAARRRAHRGGKPELFEAAAHQRAVADSYQQVFKQFGTREHATRIDGARSPEVVTEACLEVIHRAFVASRRARSRRSG